MASFRRRHGSRGIATSVLLVVYVVASMGVLPSPRVVLGWFGRASAERYPCEDCGCGCASARECWTHCCCYSEHARLVWAIENGVMPPSGIEFREEQWLAAANAVKPGSATCGLCVARIKSELRRGVATPRGVRSLASCCDRSAEPPAQPGTGGACSVDARCAEGGRGRWAGPSLSALSCKRQSSLLTVTLPIAPPASVVEFDVPLAADVEPQRPMNEACDTRVLDVLEPPPRLGGSAA